MTPEDADLCHRLLVLRDRLGEQLPEQAAQRIEELLAVANASYIRAERAAAEIAVLRRVVRAADYFVQEGQDSRYAEIRAALIEFDKEKQ